MKHPHGLSALLLGLFCTQAAAVPNPANFLIVPGKRIGQTPLGPNGSQTLASMAKPYRSDAGMSQTDSVWVSSTTRLGRRDTLFIHTVSNGALNVKPLDGVTINVIRATSSRFHTANGLFVGSTLAQVRRRFSQVKANQGSPTIYDAVLLGIAFEFAQPPTLESHCIAVIVHAPGIPRFANARQVQGLLQSPPL